MMKMVLGLIIALSVNVTNAEVIGVNERCITAQDSISEIYLVVTDEDAAKIIEGDNILIVFDVYGQVLTYKMED